MKKEVIISKKELIDSNKNILKNYKQIKLSVTDEAGCEDYLLSSLLNQNELSQYENNLLKAFDATNWMQIIYSAVPIIATAIFDNEKSHSIARLETSFGIILKNEVKIF